MNTAECANIASSNGTYNTSILTMDAYTKGLIVGGLFTLIVMSIAIRRSLRYIEQIQSKK